MRRIDRYILSELLVPGLFGGVLVLMLLVGNQLYMLLRFLYNGLPIHDLLMTLLYFVPGVLMMAIPAALLLGTALGLNRLERDREILALRMTGLRLKRIILPIIILGLLGTGGMYYLQERVIPYTTHKAYELQQRLALGSTAVLVNNDVLFKAANNYYIYVHEVDQQHQTLRGVMVLKLGNQYPTWLTIPMAENHNGEWVFRSDPATNKPPMMYCFNAQGVPTITGEINGQNNYLSLPKDIFDYALNQPSSPDELTFRELLSTYRNGVRGTAGVGFTSGLTLDAQHITFYLHRKIAQPLAALVVVLIAIPLAVHYGRSGGYVGLLLSAIVAFCFIVSDQWMRVLAENNYLHPVIAAWAPNTVFGLLGIILLFREE